MAGPPDTLAPQTEIETPVVPDVVIALGGNAFGKGDTTREGREYWESLRENVAVAAKEIAQLVFQGEKVVITHGNGPQVGFLFGQQPQVPLAHHVLKTQIQMGNLLKR